MKRFFAGKYIVIFLLSLLEIAAASGENKKYYKGTNLRRYMYVNSKEGLNVRTAPELSAEKRTLLINGDCVIVNSIGEETVIDGIRDNWIEIVLPNDLWADPCETEYGWVFGGYLSSSEILLSQNQMLSVIKERRYILADHYKPDFTGIFFSNEEEWERLKPAFKSALMNYRNSYWALENGYTIRECFVYVPPLAANPYGSMVVFPAACKVRIGSITGYVVKKDVLYPVYNGMITYGDYDYDMEICGYDIASDFVNNSVSDGKGDCLHVYQHVFYTLINSETYGTSFQCIQDVMDDYGSQGIYSGNTDYKMDNVYLQADSGKTYRLNIRPKGFLILNYPLNMDHPVPFLLDCYVDDKEGDLSIQVSLYAIIMKKNNAYLSHITDFISYDYLDSDSLPYTFYAVKDGFCLYAADVEEGSEVKPKCWLYRQDEKDPCKFVCYSESESLPEPARKKTFKVNQYCTPYKDIMTYNSDDETSYKAGSVYNGSLLRIKQIGRLETKDGITSNWVKVEPINPYMKKYNWAEAWCFGGYLE